MAKNEELKVLHKNANGEVTIFEDMKTVTKGTAQIANMDDTRTKEVVEYFKNLPRVSVTKVGNPRPHVVHNGKNIVLGYRFYTDAEKNQYDESRKSGAGTGSKRLPKQDWDSWKKDHDELEELLEVMKSSKMPEKFIKKQESLVSAHKELEPKNPLRDSLAQLGYSDAEISAIMSKAIKTA